LAVLVSVEKLASTIFSTDKTIFIATMCYPGTTTWTIQQKIINNIMRAHAVYSRVLIIYCRSGLKLLLLLKLFID